MKKYIDTYEFNNFKNELFDYDEIESIEDFEEVLKEDGYFEIEEKEKGGWCDTALDDAFKWYRKAFPAVEPLQEKLKNITSQITELKDESKQHGLELKDLGGSLDIVWNLGWQASRLNTSC